MEGKQIAGDRDFNLFLLAGLFAGIGAGINTSIFNSLQHVASMLIPVFGGLLWSAYGYQAVFVGAAVIAFLNFTLSRKIKIELAPAIQPE